jgi:hypothetical protein
MRHHLTIRSYGEKPTVTNRGRLNDGLARILGGNLAIVNNQIRSSLAHENPPPAYLLNNGLCTPTPSHFGRLSLAIENMNDRVRKFVTTSVDFCLPLAEHEDVTLWC